MCSEGKQMSTLAQRRNPFACVVIRTLGMGRPPGIDLEGVPTVIEEPYLNITLGFAYYVVQPEFLIREFFLQVESALILKAYKFEMFLLFFLPIYQGSKFRASPTTCLLELKRPLSSKKKIDDWPLKDLGHTGILPMHCARKD